MAQIFYSLVDENLQKELDARATAAKRRNTDDLRFMLEKIATVEMEAFSQGDYKVKINNSRLGGRDVLTEKFQPAGFLPTGSAALNSSRRIPPVIQSVELSIADNSYGLSQTATINLLISDPQRDLDFIEAVYMRPGRPVKLMLTHPDSAVITKARLQTTSLPTLDRLKTIYPGFTDDELQQFGKLNQLVFLGLIKSFDISYQADSTVAVTLTILGTTNVYTDLSLIGSTKKAKPDPASEADQNRIKSFYTTLVNNIDSTFADNEDFNNRITTHQKDDVYAFTKQIETKYKTTKHAWVLIGKPAKGQIEQRYATLAYIIDLINSTIQSKITEPDSATAGAVPSPYLPYNQIVFTELDNICVSNYYEYLVSANPLNIFLPDFYTRSYTAKSLIEDPTGIDRVWFGQTSFNDNGNELKFLNVTPTDKFSCPTAIFVNVTVIKQITDEMQKNNIYKVSDFIKAIVREVYKCTGGAIELKLITNPTNQTQLLLYDAKRMPTGNVQAYPIPMFANDSRGTVVHDFSFRGKLPDNVASLMTVINQGGSQLSEAILAPQLAYMYTTVDTLNELGSADNVDPEYKAALTKLEAEFETSYTENITQLKTTKEALSNKWTEPTLVAALETALKKYMQTPTQKLKESLKLTKPTIPFDVEFTIDGINGFRYGDVLQFLGLPLRYRKEIVYTIIQTAHSVDTNGTWTTKIRCIARTVLD